MNRQLCLLVFCFMLISRTVWSQDYDSTFWFQHSLRRPDSVLIKDTVLLPIDTIFSKCTYTRSPDKRRGGNTGGKVYENQGQWHSYYLTLKNDHSFVFRAYWEVGQTFSIGRWWWVSDSVLCLNWNGMMALQLSLHSRTDRTNSKVNSPLLKYPFPTRVDNWRFIRRKRQLVPYTIQ